MAIVFQSTSTAGFISGSGQAITKPTGLAVGDLMLAHIVIAKSGSTVSFSGWTSIRTNDNSGNAVPRSYLFYKVADSSDVAASDFSYTTTPGIDEKSAGSITRITGQDATTPISTSNGTSTLTTNTSFSLAIGATPSFGNSGLMIFVAGINAAGTTAGYAIATSNPTWTEIQDISNGGSSQLIVASAYATRAAATATGNVSFTRSTSSDCIAQIVIINESQGIIYTMVAALGTYTLTGISAAITSIRILSTTTGSYVLTGISAVFIRGMGLIAATGAFTLTGIDATITSVRNISADLGTITLSGITALFNRGYNLVATAGSYSLTGISAILRNSRIWSSGTKDSSTFTSGIKHTSTFTPGTKDSSTWTPGTKS